MYTCKRNTSPFSGFLVESDIEKSQSLHKQCEQAPTSSQKTPKWTRSMTQQSNWLPKHSHFQLEHFAEITSSNQNHITLNNWPVLGGKS